MSDENMFDGSTLRAHVKIIEDISKLSVWRGLKFVMFGSRAVIVGINNETGETGVLAEMTQASPVRLKEFMISPAQLNAYGDLELHDMQPRVVSLDVQELGDLASKMTSSTMFVDGSPAMFELMAERFDQSKSIIIQQDQAIAQFEEATKALTAEIEAKKDAQIAQLQQENAKLKQEKAELQSLLEESKRSKKKLREALERLKEVR